jgi:hypothetical protein
LSPPGFVPLSEKDERTAIRALTELLADQEASRDTEREDEDTN